MKPASQVLESFWDDEKRIENLRASNASLSRLLDKANEEIELLCNEIDELTKEIEDLSRNLEDAYEQGFEE